LLFSTGEVFFYLHTFMVSFMAKGVDGFAYHISLNRLGSPFVDVRALVKQLRLRLQLKHGIAPLTPKALLVG